MYTPLANGGEHAGVRLVSADHIVRMREISAATQLDATLLMPTRFSLGFMRSMDNRHRPTGDMESGLLGAAAFGHAGAGGSIGFADPSEALAFGYSMNKMGAGILLNPRGQLLVDATYRALGLPHQRAGRMDSLEGESGSRDDVSPASVGAHRRQRCRVRRLAGPSAYAVRACTIVWFDNSWMSPGANCISRRMSSRSAIASYASSSSSCCADSSPTCRVTDR